MNEDHVVLIDENNTVLGTAPKLETHNDNTPLHRGFSVFLFNKKGQLLLQQRSYKKKTWPLVWSNSVCGHPALEESPIDAAHRRLAYELELQNTKLFMILPTYRYRCEKNGIVENEICPVMIGFTDQEPIPNPDEVEATKWIAWDEWLEETQNNSQNYSQWCVEETQLLEENAQFHKLVDEQK